MTLTEPLFFDTDCLSAFLWVNEECILCRLYPGRIVIPEAVYAEISNPCVPHLRSKVDVLLQAKQATIQCIDVGTATYALYWKLTNSPDAGHMVIGRGEAAAIAMATEQNGIVASNNLRDIAVYVTEFGLQHKTTADILKDALEQGFITEEQGNVIWKEMLRRRRKLGYSSFSDYLGHK